MSVWDIFKKKPRKEGLRYVPSTNGFAPILNDFGDDIYASDLIVQAIRCKATEFKKLKPRHVRTTTDGLETISNSSIARILNEPNDYMTTSDLLEKVAILLELNKNAFIYPAYNTTNAGDRYYTGLYPLKPSVVEYLTDETGKKYLRFEFANGYTADLPAEDVIHLRKDYGVDDLFGGNIAGGDRRGLLKLLRQYDALLQSIATSLNISTKINGVVKTQTYMGKKEEQQAIADFNERLENNDSGLLVLDLKSEYTPITRDVKLVDKETIEFFYNAILRNTGVSLPILNGDYTKSQKEAFYERALEADIKALGESMTKTLFSDREKAYGNSVQLYPNNIVFMSMENKLSALQIGLPAGIFTKDEARELLGYPPMANGQGKMVAQGYNALLDENNVNKLKEEEPQAAEGGASDGKTQGQ